MTYWIKDIHGLLVAPSVPFENGLLTRSLVRQGSLATRWHACSLLALEHAQSHYQSELQIFVCTSRAYNVWAPFQVVNQVLGDMNYRWTALPTRGAPRGGNEGNRFPLLPFGNSMKAHGHLCQTYPCSPTTW